MFLTCGCGVFFTLFYVFFNISVPHDVANCYGYMAREFAAGNWSRAYYPGLPPLQTTLAGLLCCLKVSPFAAIQLVSGIFYTLAALPLYEFLKRHLSRKHASWGALMYILAPPLVKNGCTGMPDSARNFFVILSLVLIFNYLDHPERRRKLWALGLALAGLSMSRGEGLAVAFFLGVTLVFLYWRKIDFSLEWGKLKGLIFSALLLIFTSLLFMSPRLVQNYIQVGYAVPDYRVAMALSAQFENWNKHNSGEKTGHIIPPAAEELSSTPIRDAGELMIATEPSVEEEISGSLSRVIVDNIKGGFYTYLILGVVGVVFLLNRKRWKTEYNVLLLLVLFNSGLFYFVVSSPRYYMVNVLLLMVFSVNGFVLVRDFFCSRNLRWMFIVLTVLLGGYQVVRAIRPALDRSTAYQREAGRWIKEHRELFHPEEPGKLRMYQSTQSQICFWSESDPVHKSLGPLLNPVTFSTFDAAIFSPASRVWLSIMRRRPDVEEVKENPFSDKVIMFRRKVKDKND